MIALVVVCAALAGDSYLWTKQLVGVGGWPSGAMSDTRVQVRTPGHRSDSVVFQDTFYGAGARLQVTPAFIDVGPRISLAPVDVFDLDLQASWTGYAGPYAPQPFAAPVGKLEAVRGLRDDNFPMMKFELSASPTLKAKVGRIVVFDGATFAWVKAVRPADQAKPLWYEPARDLVLAWEDVTVENQGAIVYEILPGDDRPLLWVGATARTRAALVSHDAQSGAGLLVMCRPGTAPAVPSFVGQALVWTGDEERVGTMANVNLAASWVFDSHD